MAGKPPANEHGIPVSSRTEVVSHFPMQGPATAGTDGWWTGTREASQCKIFPPDRIPEPAPRAQKGRVVSIRFCVGGGGTGSR